MAITKLKTLAACLLLCCLPIGSPAQTAADAPATEPAAGVNSTVDTLNSFVKLKEGLQQDIKALNRQIGAAQSEAEKNTLRPQLEKLEADLATVTRNFENVAAGVDITSLRAVQAEDFNFQRELFGLLKPAIDEMKEMTSRVRQKSDLKEKITYYQERLPVIKQALANVEQLVAQSKGQPISKPLMATADNWRKQQSFMQGELEATQLQLDKLMAADTSIAETSQSYLKSFFQQRGLYLTEALLAILGIALLSRLSYSGLQRYVPGFRREHRSFRIRLVELIHRLLTAVLIILGPMVVFYLVEDWVLFSLGLLLLIGLAWTLRQAVPRYWHQVQIFLNIGSVREGERIFLDGLPWRVKQINIFCTLENPVAELSQRVPINDLVDLKSRPLRAEEPWFPCRKGDWVVLSDGVRGAVTGISQELVQLVQRGGTVCTYETSGFLAQNPRNLATNFRLKETIGISYNHQKDSTTSIPATLQAYIQQRVEQEGYGDKLLNLRVEFGLANTSSLDLVVVADFNGELGDLYNRLRRAIQRWCVDACTEYGWEIPFPQLTLHGAVAQSH